MLRREHHRFAASSARAGPPRSQPAAVGTSRRLDRQRWGIRRSRIVRSASPRRSALDLLAFSPSRLRCTGGCHIRRAAPGRAWHLGPTLPRNQGHHSAPLSVAVDRPAPHTLPCTSRDGVGARTRPDGAVRAAALDDPRPGARGLDCRARGKPRTRALTGRATPLQLPQPLLCPLQLASTWPGA